VLQSLHSDEGGLSPHVTSADLMSLPFSDHRHRLVAHQGSSRCSETAEAQSGPDKALHAPVVLLDDVVEVFDLAQRRPSP
jgi:hypothetical protein